MFYVMNWQMNYETVADSLRLNGDRHAERAKAHMAAGRPDWAEASMRKAERNWARAKAAEPPAWALAMVDILAQRIAGQILHGR